MRRVALFVPSIRGGGAERAMVNLARGLAEDGCSVDLVVASASAPTLPVDPGVRLIDLRAGHVSHALPRLVRYLRREQPHALVSAMTHSSVVAAAARALARVPVRLMVVEHNTISQMSANGLRRDRVAGMLTRYVYPRVDVVAAVSRGAAADLAAFTGISPDRIAVLPNPVVTAEMLDDAGAPPAHPWFAPGQPPVVLGIGRLEPQKDFPTLVRAFAALRDRVDARLMILGDGGERPALERLAASLGVESRFELPGFVPRATGFISAANVVALSSRFEGLPTVLIEALALGTPVVATDCPHGPREILGDGRYGALVPPSSPVPLAEALESALLSDRGPVPEEAWARYELASATRGYLSALFPEEARAHAARRAA